MFNIRNIFSFIFLFLIPGFIMGSPQNIDPLLKTLMNNKGVIHISNSNNFTVPVIGKPNDFLVSISIISADPVKTQKFLTDYGYKFRIYGNILSGRMDIRDIPALRELREVLYITSPTPKRLFLNKSIPFVKADLVHSAYRLPFDITGKGVVLGITDTGLDYTHQDFITDDGEMRTRYIWYQDANSENNISPPEYGYGDECDYERLKNKECPFKDIIGHGTHCSGIMGSDSKRYIGVAPDGVFIVAKSGTFENLTDGIEYVIKRSEMLNMPVVINMSLGGHYGPHDGKSVEEIAIAEMLEKGEAKGKIIVVAAGNEGSSNIHLGYQARSESQKTIMNVRNSSGYAVINLWKEKEKGLLVSIGIQSEGMEELSETEFFNGDTSVTYDIIYQDKKYAEVYFDSSYYPPSDKIMYLILINRNCSDCISSDYEFYIKIKGESYFDAWFADEDFFSVGSSFSTRSDNGLIPGDSIRTIGMPATSPYVITVAAAVSRKEYTDIEGNVHTLEDNPGDIAYFSSIGPTGDEGTTGPKPDIAAPGRVIISAFSSDGIQLQAGTQVDRFHIAMQGTSMACPHIAGLVGLLLSINPEMTANEAKRIIRFTASIPYEGFGGYDYRWGYGLVNAYEAVRMALKIGMCENESDCKSNMICKNNYCRGLKGFECESNLDCESSLVCEKKRCLSSFGGDCTSDQDCSSELRCVDNKCKMVITSKKEESSSSDYGCSCNFFD